MLTPFERERERARERDGEAEPTDLLRRVSSVSTESCGSTVTLWIESYSKATSLPPNKNGSFHFPSLHVWMLWSSLPSDEHEHGESR
jgi:hypothetical protein